MVGKKQYGQVSFFGAPNIPLVPEKDFDRAVKDYKEIEAIWEIIGPTLHVNLRNGQPLWKAVAMCYMQGISNGSRLTLEQVESGVIKVNLPRKPPFPMDDIIGGALSG